MAARLTVTELAKKAEISPGYLSQLENRKYSASAAVLGALADALACDIEDLMPPEPKEFAPSVPKGAAAA